MITKQANSFLRAMRAGRAMGGTLGVGGVIGGAMGGAINAHTLSSEEKEAIARQYGMDPKDITALRGAGRTAAATGASAALGALLGRRSGYAPAWVLGSSVVGSSLGSHKYSKNNAAKLLRAERLRG